MKLGSLKFLVAFSCLGTSAAWATTSMPARSDVIATSKAITVQDRILPTHGTARDAEGQILAFSMPDLIEIEHAATGTTIKVRPVRTESGNGMSMEIVGPIPVAATGIYSGLLPVSFDYN